MYKIIALAGKAGSGKDSLMQKILSKNPELHEIISCTTRPKREGEAHGVNYFYYTVDQMEEKILAEEMLECTVFNGWIYGTSYESLRTDCINIGVFNPSGIDSLLMRTDIDVQVIWVCAEAKTRLLRQLNRELDPNVDEIIRRYYADEEDFDGFEYFPHVKIWNGDGVSLDQAADITLTQLEAWIRSGQNRLNENS